MISPVLWFSRGKVQFEAHGCGYSDIPCSIPWGSWLQGLCLLLSAAKNDGYMFVSRYILLHKYLCRSVYIYLLSIYIYAYVCMMYVYKNVHIWTCTLYTFGTFRVSLHPNDPCLGACGPQHQMFRRRFQTTIFASAYLSIYIYSHNQTERKHIFL